METTINYSHQIAHIQVAFKAMLNKKESGMKKLSQQQMKRYMESRNVFLRAQDELRLGNMPPQQFIEVIESHYQYLSPYWN